MAVKNNQQEDAPRIMSAVLSAPPVGAGQGALYFKDVGGITEAFIVDSNGAETQITSNGGVNVGGVLGEQNTASNVGTGSGEIFKQKTGVDLELRKIKAGANVTVAIVGDDIEISTPTPTGETNTASNVGTGNQVFKQKSGVDLEFRTLKAGTNVTIVSSLDEITINAAGGGGASLTVQDEGSLIDNAVTTLNFTGTGVTATQTSPGVVQVAVSSGGSGETNTASNLGAGEGLFSTKSGVDLQFKSLVAGTNVSLVSDANTVTINASSGGGGETNTASNQGSGSGIFKQKTGVDLEFRSVIGGEGLANTQNADDVTLDLDISNLTAEATVDGANDFLVMWDDSAGAHRKVLPNNLPTGGGGEANTASNVGSGAGVFKQKSGLDLQMRSVIGGEGLAQSQNTDDVTVDLDVNSLATESSSASGDFFVFYDTSAGVHKKIDHDNMPGGGGGGTQLGVDYRITLEPAATIALRISNGSSVIPGALTLYQGDDPSVDANLSATANDLVIAHTDSAFPMVVTTIAEVSPFFTQAKRLDFPATTANDKIVSNVSKTQFKISNIQNEAATGDRLQIYIKLA